MPPTVEQTRRSFLLSPPQREATDHCSPGMTFRSQDHLEDGEYFQSGLGRGVISSLSLKASKQRDTQTRTQPPKGLMQCYVPGHLGLKGAARLWEGWHYDEGTLPLSTALWNNTVILPRLCQPAVHFSPRLYLGRLG